MMYKGDSASFIINADSFFIKTLKVSLPDFIPPNSYFKVNIKILDVKTYKEYEEDQKLLLAWLNDFNEYEKTLLAQFLTNAKVNYLPSDTVYYKIIKKEGNKNNCIEVGDTIIINFEGYFLNGRIFDSTIRRKEPFVFVYGTEYQVIKGLEKALSTMCEGENAIIILPSSLAFGKYGSSSGIVPPFTPVIYEIKVEKVIKSNFSIY
ncbi:MAG: FKBP-type peptidyl-prolyl cis-trans isomerase [Bacteroidales bacterium]|nr:FKBP-type peptidyl-prolyl cis-trans isomerase [Bacteroidales bacterium]